MARKTVILNPEGAVVPDLTAEGYSVFVMPSGVASRCLIPWRDGIPVGFGSIYSVELIILSQDAGNLYLRAGATRFDLSTPSTVNTSVSGYATYAGGTADSKTKYITLPATSHSSITTINSRDVFSFYVDRDATNASDTYEADLLVIGLRVVYDTSLISADAEPYDVMALSDVKNYLGIGVLETAKDTLLQQWISWLSLGLQDEWRRKIAVQSISGEIRNGDGSEKLVTLWSPLYSYVSNDITEDVKYRDDPSSEWTVLETTAANILIDPENPFYILLYDNYFPEGVQNIKVNYKAGYDPIPGGIIGLFLEMVQVMWHKSKQGDNLLIKQSTSKSEGGITFSTAYKSLSDEWKKVGNLYRRVTF